MIPNTHPLTPLAKAAHCPTGAGLPQPIHLARACHLVSILFRPVAVAAHQPGGPFKVVRELGLKRRETVWSLSAVGAGYLRGPAPSTRGPEWTDLWCTGCDASRIAG